MIDSTIILATEESCTGTRLACFAPETARKRKTCCDLHPSVGHSNHTLTGLSAASVAGEGSAAGASDVAVPASPSSVPAFSPCGFLYEPKGKGGMTCIKSERRYRYG